LGKGTGNTGGEMIEVRWTKTRRTIFFEASVVCVERESRLADYRKMFGILRSRQNKRTGLARKVCKASKSVIQRGADAPLWLKALPTIPLPTQTNEAP